MSHFLLFTDVAFSDCVLGNALFFALVSVMLVGRVETSICHGFVVLPVVWHFIGLLPLAFVQTIYQGFPFTACV